MPSRLIEKQDGMTPGPNVFSVHREPELPEHEEVAPSARGLGASSMRLMRKATMRSTSPSLDAAPTTSSARRASIQRTSAPLRRIEEQSAVEVKRIFEAGFQNVLLLSPSGRRSGHWATAKGHNLCPFCAPRSPRRQTTFLGYCSRHRKRS
jgi:hypothetical protein